MVAQGPIRPEHPDAEFLRRCEEASVELARVMADGLDETLRCILAINSPDEDDAVRAHRDRSEQLLREMLLKHQGHIIDLLIQRGERIQEMN